MTSEPLLPPQWKRLLAWARAGKVTRFHRSDPVPSDPKRQSDPKRLCNPKREEPNDALFMDIVPARVADRVILRIFRFPVQTVATRVRSRIPTGLLLPIERRGPLYLHRRAEKDGSAAFEP